MLAGQRHAVLERAVHALAVERHHRVRGIAEQHRAAVEMPAVEVQRAQHAGRVGGRSRARGPGSAAGRRRNRARRSARACARGRARVAKLGSPSLGRNRVTVKVLLGVGQRDAHVAAARPDVQGVGFDAEAAVGRRRNLQFLVAVAQRLEALAQRRTCAACACAQGRAGAVGADQRRRSDQRVVAARRGRRRSAACRASKSTRSRRWSKCRRRARGFGGIEQHDVEPAAMHRPDHFASRRGRSAAAGCCPSSECTMRPRIITACAITSSLEAGQAQRVQAALGQREVDRAAAFVARLARIGALLEHLDLPAARAPAGSRAGRRRGRRR